MKRRLFLQAAPAAAALTLVGCGGGGGGGGSGSNLAAGVTSTAGSVSGVRNAVAGASSYPFGSRLDITDCP